MGASGAWELRWGLGLRLVDSWGLGLEDSFSDSKLSSWSPKSLRSRWDIVTGLESGDEGRDKERGRFFGGSGVVWPGASECLGVPGSAWECLGVAWVAWAGAGAGCFFFVFLLIVYFRWLA